jgi:enoyl-CoA hydratase/carnithine racemase
MEMEQMAEDFSELTYEAADGCAWITLNRPKSLNAFTVKMYQELKAGMRLAQEDQAVEVIVVTGAGTAFSAGNDIFEMHELLTDSDPLAFYRFEDALPYGVIANVTKPLIGALNGVCSGGGLLLALVCDFAFAAESATFGIPEARVGMAGTLLPIALAGRVRPDQVKYLAFTGDHVNAVTARDMGLVLDVVPDDLLMTRVREVVAAVKQTEPTARKRYKELVNALLPSLPHQSYFPLKNPQLVEGLRSFVERRAGRTS